MDVFLGQILQFAGTFVPSGFLPCDGRQVNITDNQALFALIGTTYGGDGQSTFALPNLAGRVMIGAGTAASGTTYVLGGTGGASSVTLNPNQLPVHNHSLNVVNSSGSGAGQPSSGTYVADQSSSSSANAAYYETTPTTTMGNSISPTGASQPHDNMQPVLSVTYGIACEGIWPSQN